MMIGSIYTKESVDSDICIRVVGIETEGKIKSNKSNDTS